MLVREVVDTLIKICDEYPDDSWDMTMVSGHRADITEDFFVVKCNDDDTGEVWLTFYRTYRGEMIRQCMFKTSVHQPDIWIWTIRDADILVMDDVWENNDFIINAKSMDGRFHEFMETLPMILQMNYPMCTPS